MTAGNTKLHALTPRYLFRNKHIIENRACHDSPLHIAGKNNLSVREHALRILIKERLLVKFAASAARRASSVGTSAHTGTKANILTQVPACASPGLLALAECCPTRTSYQHIKSALVQTSPGAACMPLQIKSSSA